MRRRRNQTDAWNRMTQTRDDVVDFVARKLAAFAGFRALGHLDLKFVGVDEIVCGHAKSSGRYLLYCTAAQIAICVGIETRLVFAAFSGIRFTADPVHGNGESFM